MVALCKGQAKSQFKYTGHSDRDREQFTMLTPQTLVMACGSDQPLKGMPYRSILVKKVPGQ